MLVCLITFLHSMRELISLYTCHCQIKKAQEEAKREAEEERQRSASDTGGMPGGVPGMGGMPGMQGMMAGLMSDPEVSARFSVFSKKSVGILSSLSNILFLF